MFVTSSAIQNGAFEDKYGKRGTQFSPNGMPTYSIPVSYTHLAEQRVADLKSRGYENAGIYDPEGVGGTHVMYVLHHADKPELYSGLPKDPKVDLTVTLWKDVLKPVAAVAMGGLALAEIAHYLAVGPNVEEDVEDHHHEFEEDKKGGKDE